MILELIVAIILLGIALFSYLILPWYVGALITIFLFVFYLSWFDKRQFKKLKENYNPNDDLSTKGEARRRELGSFERANRNIADPNSPPRQQPVQATPVIQPQQDSSSTRKTSPSPRGFFAKLRSTNTK